MESEKERKWRVTREGQGKKREREGEEKERERNSLPSLLPGIQ